MADRTYSTSEVAKLVGIHPNTVRLYEEWGMITPPARKPNGYRVFTALHIYQFRIARLALQTEVLQNGLRKTATNIIKTVAQCNFDSALSQTDDYIHQIDYETVNAAEAVRIVRELCSDKSDEIPICLKRKEVSDLLGISMDTLRNWEMNGLVKIKRTDNGYRVYNYGDIRRFKVIRSLRCANYSLSAILRMLTALDAGYKDNIDAILNEPGKEEPIVSACDMLSVSLTDARKNAQSIHELLIKIKEKY